MAGALENITVVALEQAVAAPFATSKLADAGARVIKLERHDGDFARAYDCDVLGQSAHFVWLNRGKESCRINLRHDADLMLVHAMLASADVFVQNLSPGATARIGLGGASLQARHPRLIVCDIDGYASETPDHDRKAYDLLIQAETGLAAITGSPGSGPSRVGISICDIAAGLTAYAAILEALIRRQATGKGCHLEISLFDTIAEYLNVAYLGRRYGERETLRPGLAHPTIAPYGVFHLRDADIVIAVQNEREWRLLCNEVLGNPALAMDTRFCSNIERVKNRVELDALVQGRLAALSADALCALLYSAKIAYGRLSTVDDLIKHPSATFSAIETPNGPVELLATPVLTDGKRARLGPVPELGAHDASLRHEFGQRLSAPG